MAHSRMIRRSVVVFTYALFLLAYLPARVHAFNNPIRTPGQDPSVVYYNGAYYMAQSDGRINVIRSTTLTGLGSGTAVTVWTPPASGAYCCEIWAPELQLINGRFYIYFAADDGNNANHRMYVLDAASPQGPYTFRGKIAPPTDRWAIDGAVLQRGSSLYFVWSGWEGTVNDQQHLYIAPMSSPITISGDRARISSPSAAWERVVGNPFINEGPEPLVRNGKMFIVYSANGSWSDEYCLGTLTAAESADPLNPASWVKSGGCVFAKRDTAYGPGHHCYTKSPNGAEDWIVYHANTVSGSSWAGRSIRTQRFTFGANGDPVFGVPVATYDNLTPPAGEPGSLPYSRLEASNVAGQFIRHYAGRGRIDPNVSPLADSQWIIRAGLASTAGVSFESVNFPGHYLRHRNGEIWDDRNDNTALFRSDATWYRRAGLANSAQVSFESYNIAGNYIRHRSSLLYSEPVADAPGRSDATFIQWTDGAPPPPTATPTSAATATPTATPTPTPTTAPSGTPAPTPTSGTGAISTTVNYQVSNQNSGKCVDAAGGSAVDGTWVQQYTCNGTGAQQWRFTATDSGYYRIGLASATGAVWDVSGGSGATGDGVKVNLWTYLSGTNQQWLPEAVGSGYRFRARHSAKCLDVPGASTADAIQLQQWTCNGSAAQSFLLTQVP